MNCVSEFATSIISELFFLICENFELKKNSVFLVELLLFILFLVLVVTITRRSRGFLVSKKKEKRKYLKIYLKKV